MLNALNGRPVLTSGHWNVQKQKQLDIKLSAEPQIYPAKSVERTSDGNSAAVRPPPPIKSCGRPTLQSFYASAGFDGVRCWSDLVAAERPARSMELSVVRFCVQNSLYSKHVMTYVLWRMVEEKEGGVREGEGEGHYI
eukprot:196358-Pelagomonas_calceolata.AAC.1